MGTAFAKAYGVEEAKDGGKPCPPLIKYKQCFRKPCPSHCDWGGGWESRGNCTASCYSAGWHTYVRTLHNGTELECGASHNEVPCPRKECKKDCKVGPFKLFKPCQKHCGADFKIYRRQVLRHAMNGGKECPNLSMRVPCNLPPCSQDCQVRFLERARPCDI